ncbi:hypothetical protein LRC484719_27810 [Mycobacterium riyadhense]|uniref:Biofilm regulator BssS n=1 Tax=Mycobacterium riyadhense TaxID=486698 RepID=A0A653EW75_9MYCO|nr:DUF4226 domain-containing protein [Mycobacterium riyadhense]VTP00962.1 Biofilm regulator BssS [Mycobacterium riyadhense]
MSGDGWDVIGSVIGGVLGTVVGGPVGGVLGAASGYLGAGALNDSPGPQARAGAKPPPYPGSVPGVPPYPSLAPPPGANAPGTGGAADAAGSEAKALAQIIDHLEQLDSSAAATVEAIRAAGAAGQQALEAIQRDVDAKIVELGPRLSTPDGQRELREFLKDKLSSAKTIIDDQIADAETKARQTREMTQRYLDAAGGGHGGKPGDGGGAAGGGTGSSGGGSGGTDQGTTPAGAAGTMPASPYGQGMQAAMPGAGMMPAGMGMPMPSLPSFGGGGMPGLGGGDPLGALSGLGGLGNHGADAGFQDGSGHGDSGSPTLQDAQSGEGSASDKGSNLSDAGTTPAADHGPTGDPTEPPASPVTNAGDAGSGRDGGTHVALPDGTTAEARSTLGATAARAALGGAPVADAWHQAGVTVPPPGTPVTVPIPPTLLKAGDIGVWKDHLVMALGNNKVLVSGQVQPLTSVGSGPDFLGWMDPSAGSGKGGGQNAALGQPSPPPAAHPPSSQPS